MYTVKEVNRRTGVSVRTLHHYDKTGLLKPSGLTSSGYRLYDDMALQRLHSILMFREVGFSLNEIKEILDSPDFDSDEALGQQIKLLELQMDRIGRMISLAREMREKGGNVMDFDMFKDGGLDSFKEEVKAKWGGTVAYEEYQAKTAGRMPSELEGIAKELMEIFADIGALKHTAPDSAAVREKIVELQKFITDNYYNCTDEILRGLGQIYAADERFKANIDSKGGDDTAEFVAKAILVYCNG
ncbi:MAG: MerR family transcriptional regulator [Oscillospiraceae bacterium]|nr:MerR family transcriptional regulator [Oscillospiraceae bacterium]